MITVIIHIDDNLEDAVYNINPEENFYWNNVTNLKVTGVSILPNGTQLSKGNCMGK